MRFKILQIILIVFVSIDLNAQPRIQFMTTEYDFGRVANLDYPPAVFEFKNIGNEPAAILMVNKKPAIKVSYDIKFINPGETGRILVLPNLNEIGPFSEKITVITNTSDNSQILSIKGTVLTIQECFPNQNNFNIREVNVVNKITREPVPNAKVLFVHNMQNNLSGITDSQGKILKELKIGQYHVQIASNGYHPFEKDFFLSRSVPALFFEIDPLINTEPTSELSISHPIPEEIPVQPDIPSYDNEALPIDKYAANNLVFLVDVSLSMKAENKLELLKGSVSNLVNILRPIDKVAVISYAEEPAILLRSVDGSDKDKIKSVLEKLTPGGITNGVRGLNSAYDLAQKKFEPRGNNQIILATDGKFTGGNIPTEDLKRMIEENAERGIIISIIGFGVDEKAIDFMKEMAEYGKGKYIHVKSQDDISNLLIDEIKANSFIGK